MKATPLSLSGLNCCTTYLAKLLPAFVVVLTLTACSTVSDSGSYTGTNPMHFRKDLVISFPGWTSEEDKANSLRKLAKVKADQKCSGREFKLVDFFSNPFSYGPPAKTSGISANIQCEVVANNSPASSSSIVQQVNTPNNSVQNSIAIDNERIKLEEERRQLAEERRKLEEEKRKFNTKPPFSNIQDNKRQRCINLGLAPNSVDFQQCMN